MDRLMEVGWGLGKGGVKVVVVVLPPTQSFSLPSSAGVRAPASRGRVSTVGALVGEGKEQRGGGRKGWRIESVPSGQVVLTGPAQRAPLGVRGRRKGGVRCGVPTATCGTRGVRGEAYRSLIIIVQGYAVC